MDTIASALSRFGSWLLSWLTYLVGYALGVLSALFEYFLGMLRYLWELFLYPFVSMLEAAFGNIGVDYIVPVFNYAWQTPLGYFADLFLLDTGLVAIMTAHITRFIIRRLPIIG